MISRRLDAAVRMLEWHHVSTFGAYALADGQQFRYLYDFGRDLFRRLLGVICEEGESSERAGLDTDS